MSTTTITRRRRILGAQGRSSSLAATIRADVAAVRRYRDGQLYPFLFPNLFAVVVFRLAHALGRRGNAAAAHALCLLVMVLTGLDIGWRAEIGPGLFIEHTGGVVLPAGMRAGRNLRVGAGALVGRAIRRDETCDPGGFPCIGDDVAIMARASVIGPVWVGDGAVVGAHALVMKDVPAGATAIGLPARNYIDGELVP